MIWICIPVYNNIKYTLGCLDSLQQQTYCDFKIIICDDGSSDNTSETIRKNFPEVILLKGDGNLWWAGAMNQCLKYALYRGKKNDFLLLLNNDLVVKEDYLENLIKSAKPGEVFGSIAINAENENNIVYAGELLNKFSAKSRMIHRNFKKYKKLNEWEVDLLTGRGTLFPLQLLEQIGLMHNQLMPQYGADVEFSVRAKQSGFKLKIKNDVKVYSYVENTGKGSVYRKSNVKDFISSFTSLRSPNYYKSRFYFAKIYTPKYWLPVFLFLQLTWITGGFIKRSLSGMSNA
jgi:GT2 family glycosyltransferase